MKMRHCLLVVLEISAFLTLLGPFFFDRAVNPYFSSEDKIANEQLRQHRWDVYGGWYILYEKHPEWPELQIPAETRFNLAGFWLSTLLWSSIVGWIWWASWLVIREIIRRNSTQTKSSHFGANS